MSEKGQCPQCGRPLPGDSPEGLCAACLLQRGLETNTVDRTGEAAAARWTPPAAEQLSSLFPELDILELIGRGGMGAVYKARQRELNRLVALKVLPPEIGAEPTFAQRFAREAQAMARLSHPNIVTIHDFGRRESTGLGQAGGAADAGLYFFVMEYIDGLSLRQLLDRGTVSPREALAIVPQICDALQYAHDRGIVHRDIKPENILLNRAGQVKIADFGLAKLVGQAAGGAGLPGPRPGEPAPAGVTQAGEQVMGTPQYMAPEQIDRPGEVDHRADIYSLGVVFYQMLTGELPRGEFEPPSHKVLIDVRLDEVVLRALEKEPARRYQQVSEIRTRVETIAAGGTPPAPHAGVRGGHRMRFAHLPLVGARGGRRVLCWRGVLAAAGVVAAAIAGGALLVDLILYHLANGWIGGWAIGAIVLFGTIIVVGSAVWIAYRTPIGRLSNLDEPPAPRSSRHRRWLRVAGSLALAVVLALFVRTFVLHLYRVDSDAVSPEIPKGSRVFVYKLARTFRPGDIILYHRGGRNLLGRVMRDGPVKGMLTIERRGQAPQSVATVDVVGRVVFHTRSPAAPTSRPTTPATRPAGNVTCPLAATIYELRLPPDKAGLLDADALTTAAGSQDGLQKALAQRGQVRALYHMDQSVKLAGDRIMIGDDVPAVMSSRVTDRGQTINAVDYLSLGAILDITATATDRGIDARIGLEVSSMSDSQAKVTTQPMRPASIVRQAKMAYKGLMGPGKPIVILGASAGSPDAEGNAVAYVARIVLGKPQPHVRLKAPPAESLTGRLTATIHEIRLPPEQIARLQAAALTAQAAPATAWEKALADLGQAKVLYRMDQSVQLSGDRVTFQDRVPTVTGTRLTETGRSISTIRYHSVGAILDVAGAPEPDGGIAADLGLEMSAMTDSPVKITPQQAAPVMRKVVMAYKGTMRPGTPVIIVVADAVSPDAAGKAVGYVAHIVLGQPRPATRPATAR